MIAAHPDARIAIAGAGDLDAELRERARAAGIAGRVHFLGDLTQDLVGAWFAAADVAVVPSVRDDSGNVDGLPNTVLEGLASGTPLVATPAGGIASVVTDGETGVIVAERDPRALAAAIDGLLRDPDRRARLGSAGRATVAARFGWDRAAARFEAAYDRALAFKSLAR
jgi:glycosyltransferase involved in cell wall biosynthesis